MESISFPALIADQLAAARQATSGRATRTVHSGRGRALRQMVLALTAGHGLSDHESPGEATLQVLEGAVRLTTATDTWEGSTGEYAVLPAERHGLTAITDAAVLLTIVPRGAADDA